MIIKSNLCFNVPDYLNEHSWLYLRNSEITTDTEEKKIPLFLPANNDWDVDRQARVGKKKVDLSKKSQL